MSSQASGGIAATGHERAVIDALNVWARWTWENIDRTGYPSASPEGRAMKAGGATGTSARTQRLEDNPVAEHVEVCMVELQRLRPTEAFVLSRHFRHGMTMERICQEFRKNGVRVGPEKVRCWKRSGMAWMDGALRMREAV